MSDFKITRISQDPPREWKNPEGGIIFYRKVMLEGHDRPVSVGKKSADALHVGVVLQGTITPDPQHEEDKFKADKMPFNPGGGKPAFIPKDEEAIARAVALKAAVEYVASWKESSNFSDILDISDKFLTWLQARPEAPKDDEPHYEQEGF